MIVAVTNMHEFGLGSTGHISIYGPCGNPWNVTHCAGGSSGGSAAAVGARLVAGAVGTDGGGSVRFPSAYCGATGLKLTWGRIPTDSFTLANHSVTAAGPICRDAGDARLLGEAMVAGPLERHSPKGLRIGVPRDQLWNDLHPDVERACTAALDVLRDAGAEIKDVRIEGVEHALITALLSLSLEVLPATKPEAAIEIAPHLSPLLSALTKAQLLMPAVALVKADRVRAQLRSPSRERRAGRRARLALHSGAGAADRGSNRDAAIGKSSGRLREPASRGHRQPCRRSGDLGSVRLRSR